MKKALAILAVAVLCSTFAFAQVPVVNNFEVTVECPGAVLTGSDNSTPQTFTAGSEIGDLGSGTWTLTAQVGSYNIYAKFAGFASASTLTGTETWTGFFTSAPTYGGATANPVTITGTTNQCGQVITTTVTLTNWSALATAVAATYTQTYTMDLVAF